MSVLTNLAGLSPYALPMLCPVLTQSTLVPAKLRSDPALAEALRDPVSLLLAYAYYHSFLRILMYLPMRIRITHYAQCYSGVLQQRTCYYGHRC
eukprot:2525291-Rhodomonas_salina.2